MSHTPAHDTTHARASIDQAKVRLSSLASAERAKKNEQTFGEEGVEIGVLDSRGVVQLLNNGLDLFTPSRGGSGGGGLADA